MKIFSVIGVRLPMHCSGLGKVLLAQKNDAELKRYINTKGLPALTQNTITTAPRLKAELEKIREQGYAMDDGEIMDGLRCVAAPIEDINGKVRYAISVSGQTKDMHGGKLDRLILEVRRAAGEISYALGNRRI